jgi:hypothetical protein
LHIYNEEQVPYNLWASFKTVLFSKWLYAYPFVLK